MADSRGHVVPGDQPAAAAVRTAARRIPVAATCQEERPAPGRADRGLFKVNSGSHPDFPVLAGSKYEWNRYALYATVAQDDRSASNDYAEYMVNAYGSLDDVEDVFNDPKQKTDVGSGVCATEVVGQGLMWRLCGVNRGSIVVTVQGPWFGHDDQKLVGYANAIADGIS